MPEKPTFNEGLYKDIVELKSSMAQVDVLIERLDVTLMKLTDVSKSISEVLAVQSTRLDFQDKMLSNLTTLTEKIKDDQSLSEKHMADKMDHKVQMLDGKIQALEKWMWTVTGGAIVVGFVLNKFSAIVAKIF